MIEVGGGTPRRSGWARARVATAVLLSLAATTLVDSGVVRAESAPVTGDDVERTGPGSTVTMFVLDNDFDPDGDGFAVAEVVDPAHGRVAFGSNFVNYTPDVGFAGMETFTYTVRDAQGLVADGVARVWVDSAALGGDQSPVLDVDYLVAYQGSSVGFTTGRLLVNDYDPQEQPLTVVAVSEPRCRWGVVGFVGVGVHVYAGC